MDQLQRELEPLKPLQKKINELQASKLDLNGLQEHLPKKEDDIQLFKEILKVELENIKIWITGQVNSMDKRFVTLRREFDMNSINRNFKSKAELSHVKQVEEVIFSSC